MERMLKRYRNHPKMFKMKSHPIGKSINTKLTSVDSFKMTRFRKKWLQLPKKNPKNKSNHLILKLAMLVLSI